MSASLKQIQKEVLREAVSRRTSIVATFAVISLLVLLVGLWWPKKYASSTTLFVDESNVIRPLITNMTDQQGLQNQDIDRARIAKEILFGRKILDKVAKKEGFIDQNSTPIEVEQAVTGIKTATTVRNVGRNLIEISYSNSDPTLAFRVTKLFADLFIQGSIDSKKDESTEAYVFIDKQVKRYLEELKVSEKRLKEFLTNNVDGTEADSSRRMSELRADLEEAKLDLKQANTVKQDLERQIARENETIDQESPTEGLYRTRIREFEEQLATLQLSYLDSHPDIIALKINIDEMKTALREHLVREQEARRQAIARGESYQDSTAVANPLYQRLRTDLSAARTQIASLRVRIDTVQDLLHEETERLKRIHDNEATYSELSRDHEVNRDIYNELVQRREHARVSMHLDMAGQGLTFKIQEPARIPLTPSGLRFLHFMLGGLALGLLLPLGLVITYVILHPNIRIGSVLTESTGLPVLATIPHVRSPYEKRMMKIGAIRLSIVVVLILVVYFSICWLKFIGAL